MKLKTMPNSLVELVHANVIDSFSDACSSFLPIRKKPERADYQFADLNVHLAAPTQEEVPLYLEALTSKVDVTVIAHYGRLQSGMESYDKIIQILQAYASDRFSVENKGLATIIKDHLKERQTIIFRSEEIDETKQNLDIMWIGVRDFIENPAHFTNEYHDARKIAELGRKQKAFTYLQHFCIKPTYTITREKTFLEKRFSVILDSYQQGKEELFEIMDSVDAVETFNGTMMLWLAPQNYLSREIIKEYNTKRGISKPEISCGNTRTGLRALGTAGILIPKLDSLLTGEELVEQLKDNIQEGPVIHHRHYHGIISFLQQFKRLKKERERLKSLVHPSS